MRSTHQLLVFIRKRACLFALAWLVAPAVFADCAKDLHGEVYCGAGRCLRDSKGAVWCSRFYDGGAERTHNGAILCGKGECAKTLRGEIFCSSAVGGAVLKDTKGQVRCYGKCEPGDTANCERTTADSAP